MIALFDSGYGGLTVLKPILDLLPEYDYIYLGDNARAPYGNHSEEIIKKFTKEAVDFLIKKKAKLIIFACNTASSVALRAIQQEYLGKNKILGVLIPVAEKAAQITKNKHIGIIGTKATINSKGYDREILKLDNNIKISSLATPLLVPLIEEDWHKKPEAISILKKYLKRLKSKNIDTLILGCTHYPLMSKSIKKIMGKNISIIESGKTTAESLKDYLNRHPEIESTLSKKKTRQFLTTDDPIRFKEFTEKHFKMKIKTPLKVTLN